MIILTKKQRALSAINFYKQPSKFIGIGKSESFSDNPTTPIGIELELSNPIILKSVKDIRFCKPDSDNGTLEYDGIKFIHTTDINEAYQNDYTNVYLSVDLIKTEAPVGIKFNQVGLFTNTEAVTDEKGYSYPTNSDKINKVINYGTLSAIDNRQDIIRSSDQSEKIVMMIQF